MKETQPKETYSDTYLEAIGIHKTFETKVALKDLNFSVNQGEIYCLLGQNGAHSAASLFDLWNPTFKSFRLAQLN